MTRAGEKLYREPEKLTGRELWSMWRTRQRTPTRFRLAAMLMAGLVGVPLLLTLVST